ncbi:MAG: HD domain-containing phosphohydrolase [Candidatus Hydrothermales bacterium]
MKEEKWRILVVDDEETLANFIVKNITQDNIDYDVRVANSGNDALKIIEGFLPHLILQDIKLPDITGIEILKAAKALDPDVQVIMMTAYASLDTSIEALKAGAYDYLIKPFKVETLKNTIKNALNKRKLQEENKRLLNELERLNKELKVANERLKMAKAEVDKKLEEKIKKLSKILYWSDKLQSEINLEELLSLILKGVIEIVEKQDCAILIKENDTFEVCEVYGFDNIIKKEDKLHLEKEKESYIIKYQEGDIKEVIVIPLETKDGVLGVLIVGNRTGENLEELRDELLIFAKHAASSLQNALLFKKLERSYIESLLALVKAIEAKDPSLRGHSQRVSDLAVKLSKKFNLSEEEIKNIRYAALLHDVGKIGIREYLLDKPGALSKEEMELMKEHINIGIEILKPITFLKQVLPLIKYHHENWDGTGYPEQLKGEEIPLGSQIISICDVYDAITHERSYADKLSKQEAIELLKNLRGNKFGPVIVDKFIELLEETK